MKKFKRIRAVALTVAATMLIACMNMIPAAAANSYENLNVESLYFTDQNGMVVLEPAGKTGMIPNVCISKKESSVPLEGKIIVAAYGTENKLKKVNVFEANDENTEVTETVFSMTRTTYQGPAMDVPEGSSARVYFWDGFDTVIPYGAPAYLNPEPESAQYTGEITLPETFQNLTDGKFTVSKEPGTRKYSTTMSAYNTYDWSDATEIFLSTAVNYTNAQVASRLGTNKAEPIAGRNFATHYQAGDYKKADGQSLQDKFIFTLLDDYYSGASYASGQNAHTIPLTNFQFNSAFNLGEGVAIDALVRSGSPSGFTWMGSLKKQDDGDITQKWTALEGYSNVYSTVQGANAVALTLFDFNSLDAYGLPKPYVLVDTIEEVESTEGTFYQNPDAKQTIYCHPRGGDVLDDIAIQWDDSYLSGIRHDTACSKQTVMFENIGFMPKVTGHINNQFYGMDYDKAVFGFYGCKFTGGAVNVLGLGGKYTAYLNDCVAAYGFRDGFNYHDYQPDEHKIIAGAKYSKVIEVNCTSYLDGDFNRITGSATSGVTNNSNNATTAHDGIYVMRMGGRYWNTQGTPIGDSKVNESFNIGCEAYNILPVVSDKVAFGFGTLANLYVIDCYATGTLLRKGVSTGTPEYSYVLDLCGLTTTYSGDSISDRYQTITWDEIAQGKWPKNPKVFESITLTGLKTQYNKGETVDRAVGTLTINYSDGTSENIAFSDKDVTVDGFDTSKAGEATVTVGYAGKTAQYTIVVADTGSETKPLTSISLSGIKTEYQKGDTIDRTGTVIAHYSDSSTGEIAFSDSSVTVTGFDTSAEGNVTVTVHYGGKDTQYTIHVTNSGSVTKSVYHAVEDYSNEQGKNGWYYRCFDMAQYGLSNAQDLSYQSNSYWNKNNSVSYGQIRVNSGDLILEPGNMGDGALMFKAPVSGTITLTMKDDVVWVQDGSKDGAGLKIFKNDTQIYPVQDGEWLSLLSNERKAFAAMSIDVSQGDQLIFRVNKGIEEISNSEKNNEGDKLHCTPIITYKSVN